MENIQPETLIHIVGYWLGDFINSDRSDIIAWTSDLLRELRQRALEPPNPEDVRFTLGFLFAHEIGDLEINPESGYFQRLQMGIRATNNPVFSRILELFRAWRRTKSWVEAEAFETQLEDTIFEMKPFFAVNQYRIALGHKLIAHIQRNAACMASRTMHNSFAYIWAPTPIAISEFWIRPWTTFHRLPPIVSPSPSWCTISAERSRYCFLITFLYPVMPSRLLEKLVQLIPDLAGTLHWHHRTRAQWDVYRIEWSLANSSNNLGDVDIKWRDRGVKIPLTEQFVTLRFSSKSSLEQIREAIQAIAATTLLYRRLHPFTRAEEVIRKCVAKALVGPGRIPTPYAYCGLQHGQLSVMISRMLQECRVVERGNSWIATRRSIAVILSVTECVLQNPENMVDTIPTVGWSADSTSPRMALQNLSREFARIRFWLYTAADSTDDQSIGMTIRDLCGKVESLLFPLSMAESLLHDHVAHAPEDWCSWTALRATCSGISYVMPNPQCNSYVQIYGMCSKGSGQRLFHIASLQKLNIGLWREQICEAIEHTRSMHDGSCKVSLQSYPEVQWFKSASVQNIRQLRVIVLMKCDCFTFHGT